MFVWTTNLFQLDTKWFHCVPTCEKKNIFSKNQAYWEILPNVKSIKTKKIVVKCLINRDLLFLKIKYFFTNQTLFYGIHSNGIYILEIKKNNWMYRKRLDVNNHHPLPLHSLITFQLIVWYCEMCANSIQKTKSLISNENPSSYPIRSTFAWGARDILLMKTKEEQFRKQKLSSSF